MKDRVKKLTKANSSLIADLNTGLTITVSQRDEYNRIVQEHKVLNEQQNEVRCSSVTISLHARPADNSFIQ